MGLRLGSRLRGDKGRCGGGAPLANAGDADDRATDTNNDRTLNSNGVVDEDDEDDPEVVAARASLLKTINAVDPEPEAPKGVRGQGHEFLPMWKKKLKPLLLGG